MVRAPPTGQDDEVEGLDEEFLYHLEHGAALLARGEAEPARATLARARDLRPRDPKALGLLGQALYRLGRFEEAADVYGRLVDESPAEAAARVNLGLANLKAKRHAAAVRQLEIALDLAPEHRKAMGYLGLAWLEQGDFARAREWFARAGSEQMVGRCDELLALARPVAAAAAHGPLVELEPAGGGHGPDGHDSAGRAPALPAGTFSASGERLIVRVTDDVLVRGEGLLWVQGAVRLVPELKRFRGSPTEKPFGQGAGRMLRASGQGVLHYRVGGARLAAVALGPAPSYFVERAVFGFEGSLAFDNGRVASPVGGDLDVVHLKGAGTALLAARGEMVTVQVSPGAPVRVPVEALVGWVGALTPSLGPLAGTGAGEGGAAPGGPRAVELAGEGRALVDDGAAARG